MVFDADSFLNDVVAAAGFPELYVEPIRDDVVSWIEREFWIPERKHLADKAMKLEPYQKAVLAEAHRRNHEGKFIYDLILWSDIKKSIKSSIAAAVILYRALHTEFGSFKVVANDLKQADSRVFNYMRIAVTLNPKLGQRCRVKVNKIIVDNNSIIEAVPVDPKGEAGGNDDMIEFTELHAASSTASILMWTEMTLSPTKHGYSQRWIDTYAGHSGESPILEQLWEEGVKNGRRLDLGIPDLEVYANGRMLVLWNTIPRMPWQTPEYYANEEKTLTPEEFRRIHRNQWASATAKFVPIEWWYACKSDIPLQLDKYREVVVALDGSVDNDCFGMIVMSRITILVNGVQRSILYPVEIHVWIPNNKERLLYANPDNRSDDTYPEGMLRSIIARYNVLLVVYDQYQLHHMCSELEAEGLADFQVFNQGTDRLVADKQLFDLIRDRGIAYNEVENLDVLTEHLDNSDRETSEKDNTKLRIVKRANNKKIDLAVTLSMACAAALSVLPE